MRVEDIHGLGGVPLDGSSEDNAFVADHDLGADGQDVATDRVREAAGPVTVRAVGEVLGLPVEVRGKLEPLRAKLNRLADHFHKL
ncbi:hypothetical protein [Streptomyces sp. LN704]|uniref:hypothetical protein n=1 Tax=unclassified Streptomyces TaxID=2593676 RepID=UPI00371D67A3